MSQALRDARRFEEQHAAAILPSGRPGFHLSARVGWMNDPNGFSFYKGQYHLFYQYHPYDSHWGPMHWGHAVSRDLLHWAYLPAALAPDQPYDAEGCFSGSALALPDGRHALMYTGVSRRAGPDGRTVLVQNQCLAFGDGENYEKYPGNPVITEQDLPEGGSPCDFRDPRLLALPDGRCLCAVANNGPGGGQILVYESRDLIRWTYAQTAVRNNGRLGLMWECPDLFRLDGTDVLIASAQDMLPKGFEYHNGNGSFCLTGELDEKTLEFREQSDHALDYGIDFYAPQTVLTPDGRRVLIGWLQNWDTCNQHFLSYPWFGQMSLPRELFMKDGLLCQRPIRELEGLRREKLVFEDVSVRDGEITLPGVCGRMLELELTLRPDGPLYQRFSLRFAQSSSFHTSVSFRPHESVLKVDRKFSGSRRAIIHQRRAKVRHENGALKLRVILDRFSCEVFVGGGEQVLSMAVDTPVEADGVGFFADGAVLLDLTAYRLEA